MASLSDRILDASRYAPLDDDVLAKRWGVKRTAIASAAVLAATALLSPTAALAGEADTRPCVTVGEYRAVNPHEGGSAGTRAHIKAIFDTAGTVYGQSEYESGGEIQRVQWRKYDRCGSARVYRIEYHKFGSRPYVSYWG